MPSRYSPYFRKFADYGNKCSTGRDQLTRHGILFIPSREKDTIRAKPPILSALVVVMSVAYGAM